MGAEQEAAVVGLVVGAELLQERIAQRAVSDAAEEGLEMAPCLTWGLGKEVTLKRPLTSTWGQGVTSMWFDLEGISLASLRAVAF